MAILAISIYPLKKEGMTLSILMLIKRSHKKIPFIMKRQLRVWSMYTWSILEQQDNSLMDGSTLSWWRSISYRNQSIDLQNKSMDWFLYDRDLRHEKIKRQLWNYKLNQTFQIRIIHCSNKYLWKNEKYVLQYIVFKTILNKF